MRWSLSSLAAGALLFLFSTIPLAGQSKVLTAAVLVNSANTTGYNTSAGNPGEFQRFAERYLQHLQIPYQIYDLATATMPPADLSSRQLIISGHSGLSPSSAWSLAISSAVQGGTGFVNLDSDLSIGSQAHIDSIFGATGAALGNAATQISIVPAVAPGGSAPHYIAALQRKYDGSGALVYPFHAGADGVVRSATSTLLLTAQGTVIALLGSDPLIRVVTFGAGRAIHFGTLNYLHADRFGFDMGLDDLFWRSLVWAARKPFVVRGYPRFWSVQMDDNKPGWGTRVTDLYNTDFTGTSTVDGTGGPWKVTGYVYTDNLPAGSSERAGIIGDVQAGKLEIAPHSLGDVNCGNLYWNGCSGGALSDAQWQASMAAIDSWKQGNGGSDAVPSFSRSLVAHFWDLSNNTGFDLWNHFGFRYITSIQKPGFQSNLINNGAERLPARPFWNYEIPPKTLTDPNFPTENYPFFFADDYPVGSRAGLPAQTFYLFGTQYFDTSLYSRPDFEWPNALATPLPTVASSVAQLKQYTWRHWSGLDPLQLFTHDSLNYESSTLLDRQSVIAQSSQWLNANGARHIFMDDLGDYIYARNKSTLTAASYDGTHLNYTFTGSASTADGAPISTQLLVFQSDDEGVWQSVAGFTNGLQVALGLPPSVQSINPSSGSTAGGTNVTITGTGFTAGSTVYFGQAAATVLSVNSTTLQVTTPAGPAGSADVRVITPAGTVLVPGGFTYTNTCPCSVWPSTATPSVVDSNDGKSVELGVRFRSDVSGSITGIRFYKAAANTGSHVAHLWTNTGILLGTATFSGESASGWQQATFSPPVSISAGVTYVASYFAPNGHYSANFGDFAISGIDNAPLHFLRDGFDGANGIFLYSATGGFPTDTFNSGNYWVDVVLSTSGGTSGPTVTSTSPAPSAFAVPITTTVTASFSKALDPATVTASTFRLLNSGNAAVPATVAYSSSNSTATLTPSAPLDFSATYTAVITGGTNGIKDTSGNGMAADVSWNFSTTTGQSGISIWTPSTTPSVIDSNDPNAVELGVRFRSDVSGSILGIRFYKSQANTGVHTGYLWTNTGTLLASATFSGESAAGWQQVTFPTSVPIAANTTYIAAYLAPNGHYSFDAGFFASAGVDKPPLHFLKDGADGGNGAYVYGTAGGFPTETYNSANYWVDIVFADNTPSIVSQPASTTIFSGQTATLTVVASGGQPLSYQWYLGNSGDTSQPIAGATSATYTTPVLTSTKSYWVRVSNSAGSTNSATATVTVNLAHSTTTLTASPNPSVAGQSVTLTATVTAGATGTVTFLDGATSLGTGVLSGGTATLSTSALSIGSHSLTGSYGGDANFTASTSSIVTQVVNAITTKTTLTASPNPSVFGQSVTLSSTVTAVPPGTGTVTGSVTFNDGATVLGTAPLSGGSATLALTTLTSGTHSLTASYTASGNFAASTSTAVTDTVNAASTTTALSSSPNPSIFGQSVSLKATVSPVAPGAGTVQGTVTFKDGTNTLGTAALSGGSATLAVTTLTAASHSLTAVYTATASFAGSTSATVTQTVNKSSTTTSGSISPLTSVSGQSVTANFTVSPVAPGAGTPTGTLSVLIGTTVVYTAPLTNGALNTTISTIPVGNYTFTVSYGGDANFSTSTSAPFSMVVNQASTTTTLNSTPNPSVSGQAVTLTAAVAVVSPGTGTPAGSITFKDGGTTLGTVTLSNGVATLSVSSLAIGSRALTAAYGGSTELKASTSATRTQTVNQASTATALTATPNPSVVNQTVTLRATVSAVAPGTGTPTGPVTFRNGTTNLGTAQLSGGVASLNTSALAVGSHSLTAVYSGAPNFTGSTSPVFSQTVNQDSTTTALTSSVNPSVFGQTTTLRAVVSVVSPGTGTPTGSVSFRDGSTVLGTVTLGGGAANFPVSSLTAASHSLTAVYNGATNFSASTSPTLTQTVNRASTSTTLTSSRNPSTFGQSVTFTATVRSIAPGTGTPTGSVVFKDGSTTIATVSLSNGTAAFSSTSLSRGIHSITAAYQGSGNYSTSTSTTVIQTVL